MARGCVRVNNKQGVNNTLSHRFLVALSYAIKYYSGLTVTAGNGFDQTFQDRSFSDSCDEGREREGDIEGGRVNGDPSDDDPLPSGEKNDSDAEKELLLGPSGAEGTLKTQDAQVARGGEYCSVCIVLLRTALYYTRAISFDVFQCSGLH